MIYKYANIVILLSRVDLIKAVGTTPANKQIMSGGNSYILIIN